MKRSAWAWGRTVEGWGRQEKGGARGRTNDGIGARETQEVKAYFVRKSSSRMKLEHKRWRKEF